MSVPPYGCCWCFTHALGTNTTLFWQFFLLSIHILIEKSKVINNIFEQKVNPSTHAIKLPTGTLDVPSKCQNFYLNLQICVSLHLPMSCLLDFSDSSHLIAPDVTVWMASQNVANSRPPFGRPRPKVTIASNHY